MEINPERQILNRCEILLALAEEIYSVNLRHVKVSFDLLGTTAAQALFKEADGGHALYMKFNGDMVRRESFGHVHDRAVPHEIAHLVCHLKPNLGKNHDRGWARVCKRLGGVDEVLHDEPVVYSRGITYEYITSTGHTIRISDSLHQAVQSRPISFRRGKGTITSNSPYKIVGFRGQTLG